jgi:hypothetical protein
MMFGLLKYSKSFIAEEINNLTQTKWWWISGIHQWS